jgi:hypothetical protein
MQVHSSLLALYGLVLHGLPLQQIVIRSLLATLWRANAGASFAQAAAREQAGVTMRRKWH